VKAGRCESREYRTINGFGRQINAPWTRDKPVLLSRLRVALGKGYNRVRGKSAKTSRRHESLLVRFATFTPPYGVGVVLTCLTCVKAHTGSSEFERCCGGDADGEGCGTGGAGLAGGGGGGHVAVRAGSSPGGVHLVRAQSRPCAVSGCESDDQGPIRHERQKIAIERGTTLTLSRRTCSPQYGL
jgi:hypothetical protein